MIDFLVDIFIKIISAGGYTGVFFLMILESMVFPVPSEAVMPFAGFLWFAGKMSFWLIVIFSILGSIIGSLISYYIGFYGGRPFIAKYGKYFLLNLEHLSLTEKFFNKHGAKTIFISRFIPIIRHLISLPAGAGKMNLFKFSIYTIIGAGVWNTFLTYLGYHLGKNWSIIRQYSEIIDIILVVLIIGVMIFWIYKKKQRKNII